MAALTQFICEEGRDRGLAFVGYQVKSQRQCVRRLGPRPDAPGRINEGSLERGTDFICQVCIVCRVVMPTDNGCYFAEQSRRTSEVGRGDQLVGSGRIIAWKPIAPLPVCSPDQVGVGATALIIYPTSHGFVL